MTGHERLTGLLQDFREAMPETEFRESYGTEAASRRGRMMVTGQVERETRTGESWETQLVFHLWLGAKDQLAQAHGLAGRMEAIARQNQPALTQAQVGMAAVDKSSGGLVLELQLWFAGNGDDPGGPGGKKIFLIWLNGQARWVTGWKLSLGGNLKRLTAVGEDIPFYERLEPEYTVELQGLALDAGALEGFRLKLNGTVYENCQWKSFSAAGSGVLVSGERHREE